MYQNESNPSHVPKALLSGNIPQLKSNQGMVIVMHHLIIICKFNTNTQIVKYMPPSISNVLIHIQENMRSLGHLQSKIYANGGSVVLSEKVVHISGKMGIVIKNEKLITIYACDSKCGIPFNQGGFTTAKLPNNKDLE